MGLWRWVFLRGRWKWRRDGRSFNKGKGREGWRKWEKRERKIGELLEYHFFILALHIPK
jgi:hypothetical protein